MANRYAENIQRIVGLDNINNQKGLNPAQDRASIPAGQGTATLDPATGAAPGTGASSDPPPSNSDSSTPSTPTSSNAVTTPSKLQGGNADMLQNAILNSNGNTLQGTTTDAAGNTMDPGGNRGGGSSNLNITNIAGASGANLDPYAPIYGKTTGQYTADEVLNQNVGASLGVSMKDPSGTQLSGGQLKELIATDCTSGKEMRIRTDGQYTPPEATYSSPTYQTDIYKLRNSFIDPNTAVLDYFQYLANKVYLVNLYNAVPTLISSTYYSNAGDACAAAEAWIVTYPSFDHRTSLALTAGQILNIVGYNVSSTAGYQAVVAADTCTNFGNPAGVCPITAPALSYIWPNRGWYDVNARSPKLTTQVSNSFIVSFNAGVFKPHPKDPNVPAPYAQGASTVNFCFGSGQTGTMRPTKDGGFAIYQTSGASPTGVIRLYDAQGNASGFADSSILSAYVPPNS